MLFSRRLRRSRRGMQQAALFRRERQVVTVIAVFVVLGFVCVNQRDLRENNRSHIQKTMSMNIKNNNNGRSRVSRGKKMQKLKKVRANEYRVKFT